MNTNRRSIHKAARLIVLMQLKQEGKLEGKTQKEIAGLFGKTSRFTALRDLQLLPVIQAEVERLRRLIG